MHHTLAQKLEIIDAKLAELGVKRLGPYKNNKTKFQVQCIHCKEPALQTWDHISNQGTPPRCEGCLKIRHAALTEAKRIPLDRIIQELESEGVQYLSHTYVKLKYILTCKCYICENPATISFDRFRNTRGKISYPYCSAHRNTDIPRGSAHPNWIEGKDDATRGGKRDLASRAWEREIKRLANWTCDITGQRGGLLASHHLWSWLAYPEKRYDLDNGVCIQRELHTQFHTIYGRKGNTPDQYLEFKASYSKCS